MAQDFSTRYPIVDGHGNWGSIDGDSAAAMRYTEMKLTKYGQAMLNDIDKNTVDFIPNYDAEEIEPTVLPTLIPNLLANGCTGIAVGMATNMPPHNLGDIYDALIYLLDCAINEEEEDEDKLIELVKGPDFPTGGTIINSEALSNIYKTGKGKIYLRGKYEIDDDGKIIITEIPYRVNKSKLIEDIANLSRPYKEKNKPERLPIIPDITNITDESDSESIRIVIEVSKNANYDIVINNIIKHSKFQECFSVNNTVLVDKEPLVIGLKDMLTHFIVHSAEVVSRKAQYELEKIVVRKNIVEGILLLHSTSEFLYECINIIINSDSINDNLLELGFNQAQIDYILDMKTKNLSKLSKEKFEKELSEIDSVVKFNEDIININECLFKEIKVRYNELRDKFADDRRTRLKNRSLNINEEDLIKEEALVITITDQNLIKSVSEDEYNTQKRGGKGTKAAITKEDENIKYMFTTSNKDTIMFFTNLGRVHLLKAYKIPKTNKSARGKSIFNYVSLDLENEERIVNVIAADIKDSSKSLLMVTRKGVIKRLSLDRLSTRSTSTKIITFKEKDKLKGVLLVSEGDNVIINTAKGLSLTTSITSDNIRCMGRDATGVTGIRFKNEGDCVVDMCNTDKKFLLTITANGLAKRTELDAFKVQNRGGKGIIAHGVTEKSGNVVALTTVNEDEDIFVITEQGLMIRVKASDITISGRSASGVKIVSLNENDKIVGVSTSSSIAE